MNSTLPSWPNGALPAAENALDALTSTACYHRDRAEAAIARLRVAVKALEAVQDQRPNNQYYVEVDDAITLIGDIPE